MEKIIVFKQRFASASLTPVVRIAGLRCKLCKRRSRTPRSAQRRRVPKA
jgi:hypothetical protein